jgi:hypothetical protein
MTETNGRHCVLCVQRETNRLRRTLHREPTTTEIHANLTPLEAGHCCTSCAARIVADLGDVLRLAADAAASIVPGSSTGSGSRPVPGSRPPLNVDAVDPELAAVPGHDAPLLVLLEEWERMIRSERGLAPYGPASAARSHAAASKGKTVTAHTAVTLTGVVAFLQAQVPWATAEPTFPLEDFAGEVAACVRALRRWDAEWQRGSGRVVDCPHDDGQGACGYRFRLDGNDVDAYFDCPRCGSEWSVDRLMLVVAETTDASMWLDADAVIGRFGIDRTTLARWARTGKIVKRHGLYDIKPIALAQRRGA